MLHGKFTSYSNKKANLWDFIAGFNIAAENDIPVYVNGKKYNGEILQPNKNTISKLKTNKILILGKGPSLDDFISYKFKKFFIININDSYKFYEGDLVLLNKPWAFNEINKLKKNL